MQDLLREADSAEDILLVVKAGEEQKVKLQQALSGTKVFVSTKAVTVKRMVTEAAISGLERLQEYETQLETSNESFTKLCNQISELRANAFLKEAGDSVASVEHRAEEMKASSSRWSEEELGPAELREATEQSLKIEREVTNSMAEARKLIACRQIEARNKTASPNLAVGLEKLQHRLMQVQAEVANQRKLFAVAEQRSKGRKAKEEVAQKLGELEPILLEAEKAAEKYEALPAQQNAADLEESRKELKGAEQKLHEMQVNFKPLARLLESAKADDCHLRALQARSEAALTKLKCQSEACYIQSLLSEVKLRLTNCKAAVEEAEEAPKSDSTDAVEMAKALATWDRKIQAVLTSISTGRSEMSMKRLALQRLNSSATSEALEALSSAIGEMEGLSKRIGELRSKATEDRRRLFSTTETK
ncbi:Hypothetical protein SCF082_LOCUS36454 [Durusdinium trenchii]|uniref:Uncharacterized protein n=1 Tax=Durusdinium trenchii TaxID=1381693 RepID=A0ABP0PGD7_9DINO